MHTINKYIVSLFLCLIATIAHCQDQKTKVKTEQLKKELEGARTPEDSTRIYRSIEKYSNKRGFTRFLYKLVFKPVGRKDIEPTKPFRKIDVPDYRPFEGKIVRYILVQTLDPFGYSEIDSALKPEPSNFGFKVGNALHNKSSQLAIKNLLLVKRNRPLDSLLVKESERLIRSQRFTRKVKITTQFTSEAKDSVDLYIRVIDSWSLIPKFQSSGARNTITLIERNFLGTGHELENTYRTNFKTKQDAVSSRYFVPNVLNTYIMTTLSYDMDLDQNYVKYVNVERSFFSPFARWAAGAYVNQEFRSESSFDSLNVENKRNYKLSRKDFWGGHSFRIFRGNSENARTTNLITSARYLNVKYWEKPPVSYDSVGFFSGEKFYIIGLGISSRQFKQDKFLFNYSVTEDVPTGIIYGLTGGYQQKYGTHRYYTGARFAMGKYYNLGYISANIEYGTFFNNGSQQEGTFKMSALYFTTLLTGGNWKFRQFVKPQLLVGDHRLKSPFDQLSLNDRYGIPGFDSQGLFGTKRLLVTLQTQGYSPWVFAGFRLNPFFSYTMGLLGGNVTKLRESKLYSQIGIGVIISNDYLVLSSFQLSLSFYPSIPGSGSNVLKTNSYKTSDLALPTFDFGKPLIVSFQ